MINERLLGGDIKPAKETKDFFDVIQYTGDGANSKKVQGGAVSGKGAYFDGGSDYVVLPNVADYNWSPNRSFSVWVKFHSLPVASSSSEIRGVMSKTTNAAPFGWVLSTYRLNRKLQFACYQGTTPTTLESTDPLQIERWYHVVITDDGTYIKMYIDGVENDSLTSLGENVSIDNSANLYLGRYYHSHSNYESNQTLDQLRWFDKALTQEDVTALYEETNTSETVSVSDFFNDGSDISLHRFEGNFNSEPLSKAAVSSGRFLTIPEGVFNRSARDFTVTMSVKWDTIPTSGYGCFFGRPAGSDNNPIRSYIYYGSNDTGVSLEKIVGNNIYYSSQYNTVSRYAFQPDTWYDLAWKFSVEGVAYNGEFYVNGTSLGEFSMSNQGNNSNHSDAVVVGNDRAAYVFNGSVKDFRYYDRALTDQQVSDVSSGTAPTEDLRVHYKLKGDGNIEDDLQTPYFDGSGDVITASSAGLPSTGLSVSAWINIQQLKTAAVVAWGDEATGERRSLFIWDGGGNNGNYKVYFSGYASAANLGGATTLQSNTWYHVAVTETGGTAKVYLNGVQDASGSVTLNSYTGTTLRIGASGSAGENYSGLIKDVRIYDRAISLEDIEDLYNEREDDIEAISGLVRHYPLNGDSTELVQPSTAVFAGSTSSYITLPVKTIDVGENAKFTLSWWMNANSDHLGFVGEGNADQSFMIHTNTNGVLRVGLTANPIRLDVNNAYTPGVWAHYMAAFSGTEIKVYKNGTEVGSATGNVSLNGFTNYTLGKRSFNNTYGFDGRMRDVRLYSDKLDGTAATALYNETDEPTENLIAYYPLRENAETTSSTDYGYFNGSNAYAQMDSHYSAFHTQTFSIACWVKCANPSGSAQRIASTYHYNGNSHGYLLQVASSRFELNKVQSNTSHRVRPSLAVQPNRWYHIAVTTDGGSTPAKFYIDGVLQTSLDLNQSNTVSYVGSEVSFGAMSYNGGTSEYFNGAIKDLYYYSDVLTDTEVGYVMNNNLVPTDNVVAHYPLVSDTQDASGNNRHATGNNISFQGSLNGTATGVTFAGLDGTDTGVDHSLDLAVSGTPFNYNGTNYGATFSEEGLNFSPDMIWIKHRTGTGENHLLYNSLSDRHAYPNLADQGGTGLVEPLREGFELLTVNLNLNNRPYVAWCWRVGGSSGTFNLNGVGHGTYEECFGTLPSGVTAPTAISANTEAGISIVRTNGPGTFAHGLNEAPKIMITRGQAGNYSWWTAIDGVTGTQDDYVALDRIDDVNNYNGAHPFGRFTSDKFETVSAYVGGDTIHYLFHDVEGFSKVGSYNGNGGENHIETGFKPAFVMIKPITADDNWLIYDSERGGDTAMFANLANQDTPYSGRLSFTSDGFVLDTNNVGWNATGDTYIYIAFADSREGDKSASRPEPVLSNSFKVINYTGNETSQSISTVGFKPDLLWVKADIQSSNMVYDSIRGNNYLVSNLTQGQAYSASNSLDSFDEQGFTISGGGNSLNNQGTVYTAWAWKGGEGAVENHEGNISSDVSANDNAGFSIVRYTGNGDTNGASIGHGLSTSPSMIIIKNINRSTESWQVWHKDFNSSQSNLLRLNGLSQYTTIGASAYRYGNTYNSNVFSVGSANHEVNHDGDDYIAYVWSQRQGYSHFGTYNGNGGTNQITGLGFRPDFVVMKRTDADGNFQVWDSLNNPSADNDNNSVKYWSNDLGRTDAGSGVHVSFDDDGFTVSGNSGNNNSSASGSNYVYAAFKMN